MHFRDARLAMNGTPSYRIALTCKLFLTVHYCDLELAVTEILHYSKPSTDCRLEKLKNVLLTASKASLMHLNLRD